MEGEERKKSDEARKWIRKNKNFLIEKFADPVKYVSRMIRLLTNLFVRPKSAGEFFTTASDAEKLRLMERAARGANKDQRKLVEEYNRKLAQKTA